MLETLALSVGVIKNDSIFRGGGIHSTFVGKSDGGLDIYSNFSKIVIEGITNVRWVSDCFLNNCDSSSKNMLELFEGIIFFIPSFSWLIDAGTGFTSIDLHQ